MRKEWKIDRSTKKCSACKTAFEVKQKYYSAIYPLTGGAMLRCDFCLSCWPRFRDGDVPPLGPPREGETPPVLTGEYISYWKTSVPEPAKQDRRVQFNPQLAFAVFQQSDAAETTPEKDRLRFILALSLVRHKVLKLKTIERRGSDSILLLTDKSRKQYEVRDPGIGEPEMLALMQSVGELLEMSLNGADKALAGTENSQQPEQKQG